MMAIDTVMLSFCEDCEAHGGEPRSAPPLLLHALHTAAAAEEERAAHRRAPCPALAGLVLKPYPVLSRRRCPQPALLAGDQLQGGTAALAHGGRPRVPCRDGQESVHAQVGQERPRGGRGDAGRPARDLGRQGAAQPALPRRRQVARAPAAAACPGARRGCCRARWLGRRTVPGGLIWRARARGPHMHDTLTHLPAALGMALLCAHGSQLLRLTRSVTCYRRAHVACTGKNQTRRVSLTGPPALPSLLPTATPRCALGRTARKGPAPTQATGRAASSQTATTRRLHEMFASTAQPRTVRTSRTSQAHSPAHSRGPPTRRYPRHKPQRTAEDRPRAATAGWAGS
jgi:hypothetical protein